MSAYTKIGCEAYIVRDGKILLGKRGQNANGPWLGTWALPGGHLHFLEQATDCIVRELQEELAIRVAPANIELIMVTDDPKPDRQEHYIHLTYRVDIGAQEPKLNEPDMCDGWEWFAVDAIPNNIFPPHAKIIAALRAKHM